MRLYFGVRSPISRTVLLVRLADVESREPAHSDVLLQLRDVLRDQVLDRVLRLSKVWLLQEDVLPDEVLDLPIAPLGAAILSRAEAHGQGPDRGEHLEAAGEHHCAPVRAIQRPRGGRVTLFG